MLDSFGQQFIVTMFLICFNFDCLKYRFNMSKEILKF